MSIYSRGIKKIPNVYINQDIENIIEKDVISVGNVIKLLLSSMDILNFIQELNNSDGYIRHIYTKGGCYKFHILLSKMYNNCTPYISGTNDHIITRYRGKFYDINGVVDNLNGYRKLSIHEIPMVNNWSFHRNNLLVLEECPNCEEPLTYN